MDDGPENQKKNKKIIKKRGSYPSGWAPRALSSTLGRCHQLCSQLVPWCILGDSQSLLHPLTLCYLLCSGWPCPLAQDLSPALAYGAGLIGSWQTQSSLKVMPHA